MSALYRMVQFLVGERLSILGGPWGNSGNRQQADVGGGMSCRWLVVLQHQNQEGFEFGYFGSGISKEAHIEIVPLLFFLAWPLMGVWKGGQCFWLWQLFARRPGVIIVIVMTSEQVYYFVLMMHEILNLVRLFLLLFVSRVSIVSRCKRSKGLTPVYLE